MYQFNNVICHQYNIEVKNKYEILQQNQDTSKWEKLKLSLVESAEKCVPKQNKKAKQKWMTNDIIDLIQKRQSINNKNSKEYKDLNNEIKAKCKMEKLVYNK